MRHLTLTGPNAGQLICGADRANALAAGDTSAHATWIADWRDEIPARPTCETCWALWREVMTEPTDVDDSPCLCGAGDHSDMECLEQEAGE